MRPASWARVDAALMSTLACSAKLTLSTPLSARPWVAQQVHADACAHAAMSCIVTWLPWLLGDRCCAERGLGVDGLSLRQSCSQPEELCDHSLLGQFGMGHAWRTCFALAVHAE